MESKLSSNISKLNLISIFLKSSLSIPIIVLFFQDNGLDLSQVFLLQTVFAVAMFLFEVPTGYFGDRFGSKISISIGCIIVSIGFILYSQWNSFIDFAIVETILAVWFCFISGSETALLYETLKKLGRENEYKKIEGRQSFGYEIGACIGWIVGWLIAHYIGFSETILIHGILMSLSIPLALSLVSIKIPSQNPDTSIWRNMWNVVVFSLHGNKKLKWIIAYTSLLGTMSLCIVRAGQPYFELIAIPLVRFGIIWWGLRTVVAVASLYSHQWDKLIGVRWGLLTLLAFGVSGYFIMWFNPVWFNSWLPIVIWLFGISLFYTQRGLQKPITNHAINELAPSEIRATVLSVNSMIGRLFFAILWPIIWRVGDLYSLQTMLLFSGTIFAILGILSFYKLFYAHRNHEMANVK